VLLLEFALLACFLAFRCETRNKMSSLQNIFVILLVMAVLVSVLALVTTHY